MEKIKYKDMTYRQRHAYVKNTKFEDMPFARQLSYSLSLIFTYGIIICLAMVFYQVATEPLYPPTPAGQRQKAIDKAHGELYYRINRRMSFPDSHKSIHKSEVICKDHMIIMRRFSCKNAFGMRSTHDASLHSNLSGTKVWNIVIN